MRKLLFCNVVCYPSGLGGGTLVFSSVSFKSSLSLLEPKRGWKLITCWMGGGERNIFYFWVTKNFYGLPDFFFFQIGKALVVIINNIWWFITRAWLAKRRVKIIFIIENKLLKYSVIIWNTPVYFFLYIIIAYQGEGVGVGVWNIDTKNSIFTYKIKNKSENYTAINFWEYHCSA